MKTLRDALNELADTIKHTAADDSEPDWIACHVLNCGRAALRLKNAVSDGEFAQMKALAEKRATGKPLSQVLGYVDFYGLEIRVDEDVLTPRPETELLVETALNFLKDKKGARALDMCTGSGCIAIALAAFSKADIVASDISEKALAKASLNAELNGARIEFVRSDAFDAIKGRFGLIVSNPPYIPSAEIEGLDCEVRDFEPRIALDGGEDGLDFYRIMAANAAKYLVDGGALLLECGEGQSSEIIKMLGKFDCETLFDLQGKDRIVKAVKRNVR